MLVSLKYKVYSQELLMEMLERYNILEGRKITLIPFDIEVWINEVKGDIVDIYIEDINKPLGFINVKLKKNQKFIINMHGSMEVKIELSVIEIYDHPK